MQTSHVQRGGKIMAMSKKPRARLPDSFPPHSEITTDSGDGQESAPPIGWRSVLDIHPAADLFPAMNLVLELVELGEDIKKHGLREKVKVQKVKGTKPAQWRLLDGRSRLDAMKTVGDLPEWLISKGRPNPEIFEAIGEDVDPYAYVISANILRRHLTTGQKRKLLAQLIEVDPTKSNRQIAATVGVSHNTVSDVRTGLEARGQIDHVETRTDTRGRQQPATKPAVTAQAARTDTATTAATGSSVDPAASAEARKAQADAADTGKIPQPNDPKDQSTWTDTYRLQVADCSLGITRDGLYKIRTEMLGELLTPNRRARYDELHGQIEQALSEMRSLIGDELVERAVAADAAST
jgi:hypothetical protein